LESPYFWARFLVPVAFLYTADICHRALSRGSWISSSDKPRGAAKVAALTKCPRSVSAFNSSLLPSFSFTPSKRGPDNQPLKTGQGLFLPGLEIHYKCLIHISWRHARCCRYLFRFWFFSHQCLGSEHKGRDRGRILKGESCNLGRINDSSLDQVFILTCFSI
jgi:hypothetical protein